MVSTSMNAITTVVGFGMSMTLIVFICAKLICRQMHSDTARGTAAAAPVAVAVSETDSRSEYDNSFHGLEAVVIAGIPTMKFDSKAFNSKEDAQCSICLGEYQEKEILRIMPTCSHTFHLSCIDQWLQKQATCPVCRLSFQDSVESSLFFSENSHRQLLTTHQNSSWHEINLDDQGQVLGNLESSHNEEEIRR